MVILISGTTHSGKTLLAQKLMEKKHFPYLSIDHLKMGLIRSKITNLTVFDDDKLTDYIWPIIKEIILTNIENNQNIIIEGIYIPFNFKEYFSDEELKYIQYYCLIMSENYIENHFLDIINYGNVIEKRLPNNTLNKNDLISEHQYYLKMCLKYHLTYILIDDSYSINLSVFD